MAVAPFRVVEHLDVIEDISPGLLPGGVDATADPFGRLKRTRMLYRMLMRLKVCSPDGYDQAAAILRPGSGVGAKRMVGAQVAGEHIQHSSGVSDGFGVGRHASIPPRTAMASATGRTQIGVLDS